MDTQHTCKCVHLHTEPSHDTNAHTYTHKHTHTHTHAHVRVLPCSLRWGGASPQTEVLDKALPLSASLPLSETGLKSSLKCLKTTALSGNGPVIPSWANHSPKLPAAHCRAPTPGSPPG